MLLLVVLLFLVFLCVSFDRYISSYLHIYVYIDVVPHIFDLSLHMSICIYIYERTNQWVCREPYSVVLLCFCTLGRVSFSVNGRGGHRHARTLAAATALFSKPALDDPEVSDLRCFFLMPGTWA